MSHIAPNTPRRRYQPPVRSTERQQLTCLPPFRLAKQTRRQLISEALIQTSHRMRYQRRVAGGCTAPPQAEPAMNAPEAITPHRERNSAFRRHPQTDPDRCSKLSASDPWGQGAIGRHSRRRVLRPMPCLTHAPSPSVILELARRSSAMLLACSGSSEAYPAWGEEGTKKPPGLRLATAPSGAPAEPPKRRRKGAPRLAR